MKSIAWWILVGSQVISSFVYADAKCIMQEEPIHDQSGTYYLTFTDASCLDNYVQQKIAAISNAVTGNSQAIVTNAGDIKTNAGDIKTKADKTSLVKGLTSIQHYTNQQLQEVKSEVDSNAKKIKENADYTFNKGEDILKRSNQYTFDKGEDILKRSNQYTFDKGEDILKRSKQYTVQQLQEVKDEKSDTDSKIKSIHKEMDNRKGFIDGVIKNISAGSIRQDEMLSNYMVKILVEGVCTVPEVFINYMPVDLNTGTNPWDPTISKKLENNKSTLVSLSNSFSRGMAGWSYGIQDTISIVGSIGGRSIGVGVSIKAKRDDKGQAGDDLLCGNSIGNTGFTSDFSHCVIPGTLDKITKIDAHTLKVHC